MIEKEIYLFCITCKVEHLDEYISLRNWNQLNNTTSNLLDVFNIDVSPERGRNQC